MRLFYFLIPAMMLALPLHAKTAQMSLPIASVQSEAVTIGDKLRPEVVLPAACCKICRKGKACGDSCISKPKACHKGPGCACNG